ncbi:FKBP-type peptidyl-prolyl cis-trans isomerase [Homoserinibacter sp. YIM 151385]|uniref:FKBP-type peptidyl-prolyl cis-trans isomerase n=1 Tax=Homoserinibacter sp. YIM 151385 TaxID=2985506 RepID=UPI0022F11278|nr:FKBP-type peptidyl-prolyl cis-trans isomerase [Homoserinibacter sp. YIM 151385]WBU39329.1 FKBP-type peptidyl-prolyl cis-trans isomerase [Homoserinibacter sp. YIM 151385]
MRRALPVLAASAAVALALAGCTPDSGTTSQEGASDACRPTASGAASESVKVSGELGAKPEIEAPTPIEGVEETQRTVVTEGDGDLVEPGATANVQFTLINGTTGEPATETSYEEDATEAIVVDEEQYLPGLVKAVECSTVGSRIVGVVPPADAFGEQGLEQFAIGAEDPIVFVVDIVSIKKPLVPAEWTEDVPEVEFDGDGIPTLTLPKTDPPKELQLKVLEEGDGATVESGDTVTVDYQGTSWDTGEVFDESFTKEPLEIATGSVVQGFEAALVGQKVGSKVVVVMPPELAYGTDPEAHALGGQTLVFVMDIQDTAKS